MEEKLLEFQKYIEEEKAKTQSMIDGLVRDERADEARPYRACFNIYDVFTTLLTTAVKKSNGDAKLAKEEFQRLATNVPMSWKKSLEEAKKHDDIEKVIMEEAKLNTADKIIERVNQIF